MSLWFTATIIFGFTASILNIARLSYSYQVLGFFGVLGSVVIDFYWTPVWAFFLLITRIMHSGQVISGDLCEEDNCDLKKGYMKSTGRFLIGWLIFTGLFMCLIIKVHTGKDKQNSIYPKDD